MRRVSIAALVIVGAFTAFAQAAPVTRYSAWQSEYFTPAQMSAGLAIESMDPAGDGIPNLMKYALGLSPWEDASPFQPKIGFAGNRYTLEHRKVVGAADIQYVLEGSDDLVTWTDGRTLAEIAGSVAIAPGLELVTMRDWLEASPGRSRFLRLRIEKSETGVDSDGDGLPDAWELQYLGSLSTGASADPDGDGLTNLSEHEFGTNPINSDSDADGLGDRIEVDRGTNPLSSDSDRDGMPDGWEAVNGLDPLLNDARPDQDGDGISNSTEFKQQTDPKDYYNGTLPHLQSLLGEGGALTPEGSIAVRVMRNGEILSNAPVTFRAKSGGHLLSASKDAPGLTEITVRSDASGIAQVFVQQ